MSGDAAASARPVLRILITIVAALAGLALLTWQVREVGPAAIVAGLSSVGIGFLVVLVLSFLRLFLRGLAWWILIPERLPVRTVLAATMVGDTLGNLTPLNVLVGEPAKALYLSPAVKPSRGLASLTAETFLYSVSVALYILVGTGTMLVAFAVPDDLRLVALTSIGLMAAILGGAVWLAWRRPSVLSAVAARLPVRLLGNMADRVRDFEVHAYGSVGRQRGGLARLAACEAAFHLLSFLEVWYTLSLLTGRSLPLEAFVLDTFSRIINVAFKMVPFRIGVDEYASTVVAAAIGLSEATGLTLALVRKGRVLLWSAVGLLLFTRRGLTSPGVPRSPSTS